MPYRVGLLLRFISHPYAAPDAAFLGMHTYSLVILGRAGLCWLCSYSHWSRYAYQFI